MPTTSKAPSAVPVMIMVIIIIVLLTGVIWHFKSSSTKKHMAEKQKANTEKVATEKYAAAPPPAPRVIPPSERPWSFRTLEIPAEGVPVYLYQGWKDYAFGGAITITTPGGQVLHDNPGVNNQWGFQPAGMYIFRAKPVGSKRSVQIYNRW